MHRHAPRVLLTSLLLLPLAACASGAAQGPVSARTATDVAAPKAPPSAAARAALRDTLQAILTQGVIDSAFPGAIAVIGNHDGPLVTVAAGHLDWAPSPVPNDRTLWDLASLTKVVGMTSAMMQLVEQGKVDLDAPVQRYLPEWQGVNKDKVTVRDLITHRSGLPAFKTYYKLNLSPDSTLRLFFDTPLDTLPGVRMVYSDIGAILLGKIVERVSGETLDRYLAQHVFQPLGMLDTQYRPDSSLLSRIAPTERDPWRGRLVHGEVHDENAYALGGVSGHAGLFSTAHDLSRLAQAYLNGGALDGARLAKASTIRQFTTVQDSAFSSRALGWDTPSDRSSAGHFITRPAFGHTGFTGTSLWIAPQYDLYVILLTNRVNPTRERSGIGRVRVQVADAAMKVLDPDVVAAIEARGGSTSSHQRR
ncbi:MAG TPA: serine hydrolase domain-containing protein [Gemmatimonadaceae bacterium]|nr:serine hydrolase domain-containing protein [Gemmatimonadaceae bacterium]